MVFVFSLNWSGWKDHKALFNKVPEIHGTIHFLYLGYVALISEEFLSRNKITKDDIEKYISTIEETNGESESEESESEME